MNDETGLFQFDVIAKSKDARLGQLITPHGTILTPAFMPVATQAAVKTLTQKQVEMLGAQILLSNTYHLMLRPGADRVASLGGLHTMMAWKKPILTDSGGFQVASLKALCRVGDEGVIFKSHLDGSQHSLSPEKSIAIQEKLGSDIAMVLDECITYKSSRPEIEKAANRSLQWARRSQAAHNKHDQALFGIVQGGTEESIRRENAEALIELEFPGYGIGGLAIGEPKELTRAMTEVSTTVLPSNSPRYLMGSGTPVDIIESIAHGVDLFDCVLPTRNARNGTLFTSQGKMSIKNARHSNQPDPPDPTCKCYTCQNFSCAYLRHLFVSRETSGQTLNTIHNLHFYMTLMEQIREAIKEDRFEVLRRSLSHLDNTVA